MMLPAFFFFQDFKVLTLLGKGSFACVYRAKSVNTSMEVAIKTVRLARSLDIITVLCIAHSGSLVDVPPSGAPGTQTSLSFVPAD